MTTEKTFKKVEAEITVLSENMHTVESHRYPPGVRPFKSPSEIRELDDQWNASKNQAFEIRIPVAMGMSRRCVLALVHHEWTRISKSVYSEAVQDHLEALKPLTSKKAFYETCKVNSTDGAEEDIAMDEASRRALSSLVLDEPDRPRPNELLVRRRAEVLYTEVHDKIIKLLEEEDKQKKEQKEQQRKQDEEDAKAKPADILKSIIGREVDAKISQ
eukprot:247171-Pyramimonas_sp.AAC.1